MMFGFEKCGASEEGFLVVLEGVDASGKTSAVEYIKNHFERSKRFNKVITTTELGESELGKQIRSIIKYNDTISFETKILLVLAARNDHLQKVIKPNLADGNVIICDRYVYSTFAYQCFYEFIKKAIKEIGDKNLVSVIGESEEWCHIIRKIHYAIDIVAPNMVLYFDVDHDISKLRVENRKRLKDGVPLYNHNEDVNAKDVYDGLPESEFNILKEGYARALGLSYPNILIKENTHIINGNVSLDEANTQIETILNAYFKD